MSCCHLCEKETSLMTPCCRVSLCEDCAMDGCGNLCRCCEVRRNKISLSICKQNKIPITLIAQGVNELFFSVCGGSRVTHLYSGLVIGFTVDCIKLEYKVDNIRCLVFISYEDIYQWKPKNAPDNFTCGKLNEIWVEWYRTKKYMNSQKAQSDIMSDIDSTEPLCGWLLPFHLRYEYVKEKHYMNYI